MNAFDKLNLNNLYNADIKRQFITDFTFNDDSRLTLYYMFVKTAKIEKEKGKDLYDMVTEELEEVYHSMKARTLSSSANYINNIYKYLDWCIENGFTSSNLKDFEMNIRGNYASKFVSKSLTSCYTYEDIKEAYKDINFVGDQAIIQCVFEGIRGQRNSEIVNLQPKHIFEEGDKCYANLIDSEKNQRRDRFEITRELYNMLVNLSNMTYYVDARGAESFLEDTPYIFRRARSGRKGKLLKERHVSASYFGNKMLFFKNVFHNKNFTLRDIFVSGMMHYLNQLLIEEGTREVTNELLEKVADKYDVGIYIHSIIKKKTYSYSKIRSMIDEDFFIENYGEFKFV